jgi:xanthine/uracil permease
MASTATAPPPAVHPKHGTAATTSPAARPVSARRHFAWLVGGIAGAFLVPFIVADQLGLQRDLYYALYVAAVVGLFVAWARDTRQPLREMVVRRWRLAVGLGVGFAAISAFIATRADGGTDHPGGIEFIAAIGWRGIVYGAADGLLLSAFPILLVFAALRDSRLRRRAGGIVAVGAVAMVASLAMTAVYHAGYSDFRSDKLRKPVTGDLVWSVPTLATLNPVGSPIAHVGLHVGAVVHNYDTDLFLPPH